MAISNAKWKKRGMIHRNGQARYWGAVGDELSGIVEGVFVVGEGCGWAVSLLSSSYL